MLGISANSHAADASQLESAEKIYLNLSIQVKEIFCEFFNPNIYYKNYSLYNISKKQTQ